MDVAGLGVPGANAMLQTIVTMTLSFMVFTFGSLLVALQVASGQLTPRIIATTLLRNNVVRYTVGLFVFTMMFAIGVLDRMETQAHQLAILTAGVLGISCIGAFLFLIDYAAKMLRPVSVVADVGEKGLAVIEHVYPAKPSRPRTSKAASGARQDRTRILHPGRSQIILAVNTAALVAEARRAGGVIEIVPSVGDFVATDEQLFALHGGAAKIDERRLHAAIAFGPERTMDQDPTFAFRILIDIALKALSPAINDPTTAVLALDQIHRLLRMVGKRHLRTDEICDDSDQLSVILRTRTGRIRPSGVHRDPSLRQKQFAGRAAHARDDREPDRDPAGAPSCGAEPATGTVRSRNTGAIFIRGRSGLRPHSGLAGAGRAAHLMTMVRETRGVDPMRTPWLFASALVMALPLSSPARAQVTIDVAKITCDQWLAYKIADPDHIAIWLSGYYNSKRSNTVIDVQVFKENISRLRDLCRRDLNVPLMQVVEGQIGARNRSTSRREVT